LPADAGGDSPKNLELPQIVGQLTILPKHWWQANEPRRDIAATTLESPLGSGPYRIKDFEPGRTITYEQVENYWGKDLNVRIGRDNFAELRFEYFRDFTVEFEAFKADQFDWYEERSAKNWATGYDFPAVEEKRVVLEEFPIRNMGVMQALVPNIRRRKFSRPQVRRALNFAFDFELTNKQIFYGQYKRIASYFEGTELACSGLPRGRELEILKRCGQTCRWKCSLLRIRIPSVEMRMQRGTICAKLRSWWSWQDSTCVISSLSIRQRANR
jgi:microcin C transport system substrate-binding protein